MTSDKTATKTIKANPDVWKAFRVYCVNKGTSASAELDRMIKQRLK